jgi:hypothetical protein
MGKQKPAAAAGAVATGPVPRPPVLEHTTAELVSLIASLSERDDFTVDILGQAFALAQQRVGISVTGATPTEPPSTNAQPYKPQQPATTQQILDALLELIGSEEDVLICSPAVLGDDKDRERTSAKAVKLSSIGKALLKKADPMDQTARSKVTPFAAFFRKLMQEPSRKRSDDLLYQAAYFKADHGIFSSCGASRRVLAFNSFKCCGLPMDRRCTM